MDLAVEEPATWQLLLDLEAKYTGVEKVRRQGAQEAFGVWLTVFRLRTQARQPHPDIGDWWTLYDYGIQAVKAWPVDYQHPYPEVAKRQRDKEAAKRAKAEQRKK